MDKTAYSIHDLVFESSSDSLPVANLGMSHTTYYKERKDGLLAFPSAGPIIAVLGRNKRIPCRQGNVLSEDWGVLKKEAEDMLKAWYNARPEVLRWQTNTNAYAVDHGLTRTLMGRYRQLLPDATGDDRKSLDHSLRASINTPIQGERQMWQ